MDYGLHLVILACIYLVLAPSLNLLVGYTGLLSLSHAAFFGIGAYASALTGLRLGWGFPGGLAVAVVVAGVLAALLAVPSLRLRGDYFILGSLGFQVIIHDVLYNWDPVTNGAWGLSDIPRPRLGPVTLASHGGILLLYAPIALLCLLLVWRVAVSPFGRVLTAIREDETAATALGKDVWGCKMRVFVMASALAAVGGALYAHYVTYIDPTTFGFVESVYILSLVVVGGAGNTRGPVVGVVVLLLLPEAIRFVGFPTSVAGNLRQMVYAAMMLAFLLVRPRGLAGEAVLS